MPKAGGRAGSGGLELPRGTGAVARLWLCRSPPSCSLNTQPGFPGIWQLAGVGVPGAESPGRKEGGCSAVKLVPRTKASEATPYKQTVAALLNCLPTNTAHP